MSLQNNNENAPLPIDLASLAIGAGEESHHLVPQTALQSIRSILSSHDPVSLLELAREHFNLPVKNENGEERQQSLSELVVLVVERFVKLLEEKGLGARVLNGLPHLYSGTHWFPIEDNECSSLLGELAECLGCQVVQSRIFTFREKLLKQFYATRGEMLELGFLGRILINFKNGTMEIHDGEEKLRAFRKEDALTYQLPFAYDEGADCPQFERYLARVLPDPASRDLLSEFLGWIFLKDLKLEKVLVLYGDGHNGKSVAFDVVNALLGEANVTNLGLSSLAKIENRHQLGAALLNFGSEINERCDADLFKKLASGEPVEARRLYKDIHIMRNYARLAFNANILPKDTEHTTGFFRRFLIVPFTETISESEKDPDLARKIIATELPGVFNWVMGGLRRLRLARKFSTCTAADQALATYRKESDSVAMFLDEEAWQKSPEGRIGKDELYNQYRDFCLRSGYRPLNKNNLGKRLLRQHLIEDSKSGGCRFWNMIKAERED